MIESVDLASFGGTPISVSRGESSEVLWDFGVIAPTEEQRERVLSSWRSRTIEQHLGMLVSQDAPEDVFASEIEEKVFGKRLPTWNQKSVGSCVAHGTGRAFQDSLLVQILLNPGTYQWPGAEVCREGIYAGSRVEVGGGRLRGGDGSVGVWAADWMTRWGGGLLYKKYPEADLSDGYNESRCREWGDKGVPDSLEKYAKECPIKEAAMVTTLEGLTAAIRALKFVSICGSKGRTMQRRPGGWCPVQGGWAHCQAIRGRCLVQGGASSPFGGDGAFPYAGNIEMFEYGNSWADYLGDLNNQVKLASGKIYILPAGHYLSRPEEILSELRQQDTFSFTGPRGWVYESIPWIFARTV